MSSSPTDLLADGAEGTMPPRAHADAPRPATAGALPSRRRKRRRWQPIALLYLAPAFAFFTAFGLYPLGRTVWLSFHRWDGITDQEWVGLEHYRSVVTDPEIREALQHSFVFIIFYALLPIATALMVVGLITRVRVRGLTWFRVALFIPQILPMTVVAIAFRWVYATNGPLNQALDAVGLSSVSRAWLGDFTWALPAVGLVGSWVMFGLCFVLLLAGVEKIPTELYEAARVDGAGAIREFFTVTVPGLRGEITVALLLTITAALRSFDLVFVMTGGGPGTTTTVPSTFIYRAVFQTREIGLGATIGIVLMLLILAVNLSILAYRRRQRVST